jgi:hypothetical protein
MSCVETQVSLDLVVRTAALLVASLENVGAIAPSQTHHHFHTIVTPSFTVTRERGLIRAYVHPQARRG